MCDIILKFDPFHIYFLIQMHVLRGGGMNRKQSGVITIQSTLDSNLHIQVRISSTWDWRLDVPLWKTIYFTIWLLNQKYVKCGVKVKSPLKSKLNFDLEFLPSYVSTMIKNRSRSGIQIAILHALSKKIYSLYYNTLMSLKILYCKIIKFLQSIDYIVVLCGNRPLFDFAKFVFHEVS